MLEKKVIVKKLASIQNLGEVNLLCTDKTGTITEGPAMTALVRAIAAREVQRIYRALAHGVPAWRDAIIEAPIGRDPKVRTRMAVVAGGKAARTDVVCLARGAAACGLQCTGV